jgi:lipoprotein signal peptidase
MSFDADVMIVAAAGCANLIDVIWRGAVAEFIGSYSLWSFCNFPQRFKPKSIKSTKIEGK